MITNERELKNKYFDLLAEKFNHEEQLASEIISLESILELPKGTEHFVSDLHGCLLYTSPSPRDGLLSRMPSSA